MLLTPSPVWQVGKALLSLAKLYMASAAPDSRQLAIAAISRAQDVMTVCQVGCIRSLLSCELLCQKFMLLCLLRGAIAVCCLT